MNRRHDVVIVGGGPAGSALAALLARDGRDVAVLEKELFPRDKLCGEFLSTESQRLLREIGCLDAVTAQGPARIRMGRFFSPSGRAAAFSMQGEALGLSRAALDATLFEHAKRQGAAAMEGVLVTRMRPGEPEAAVDFERRARQSAPRTGTLRAGLLVAAYGRRSALDARLGRSISSPPGSFVGFKRHHRFLESNAGRAFAQELEGCVELHVFDGGYCGLSFVEGGVVNVCMLLQQKFVSKLASTRWDTIRQALRDSSRSLRGRLEALEPCEETTHAVGQVSLLPKESRLGSVAFIGDAAAMIAPLCGDGQAMALQSAVLLARRLKWDRGRQQSPEALAASWEQDWRQEFTRRLALGRGLQALLLRPAGCEAAVLALRLFPGLGSRLVRLTRGV